MPLQAKADQAEQNIADILNPKGSDGDRKANQLEFDASITKINDEIKELENSIKADADRQAADIRVDNKIAEADRIKEEFDRSKANGTSNGNSSTNGVNSNPNTMVINGTTYYPIDGGGYTTTKPSISTPNLNLNTGYNQPPINYADRSSVNSSDVSGYGDYILPTGRQSIDPTRTSFSQATVSYQKTGKDYNYDTIVADMKTNNSWIGEPVDVVNMPDGVPTSMDNTRVLAAREAGVKVEANVHSYSDPIPESRARSLEYKGNIPKTWGEAIESRVYKQSKEGFAPKEWAEQFPNGSIYDPEVTK